MKSLKKPVCISLNDEQLSRIDARAAQTGMNRSKQLQRDLSAYWSLLETGMMRVKTLFTETDARYLANMFRGKILPPTEDIQWADGRLSKHIQDSSRYGDEEERALRIAAVLKRKTDRYVVFALMDWLRRAAVNSEDTTLFEGWARESEQP